MSDTPDSDERDRILLQFFRQLAMADSLEEVRMAATHAIVAIEGSPAPLADGPAQS